MLRHVYLRDFICCLCLRTCVWLQVQVLQALCQEVDSLCQEVDFSEIDKAVLQELLPYSLAGMHQCSGGAALIP